MADVKPRAIIPAFVRSLRLQLNILVTLFLLLPLLLYSVFSSVDRERRDEGSAILRDNGTLVGTALKPLLETIPPERYGQLPAALAPFGSPQRRIDLLFKPVMASGEEGFFYLADVPAIAPPQRAAERDRLEKLGILDRLTQSCAGNVPLNDHAVIPGQGAEVLVSVSPVQTTNGCWAVVISASSETALAAVDDEAYWRKPVMRLALVLYLGMALIAVTIFLLIRSALRRLRETALAIEQGEQFADNVPVPEFRQLAQDFDEMVRRLRNAAAILKTAAEDNAHAFKGPVAVIRQTIDVFDRGSPDPDQLRTAHAAISTALDRLSGLIQSARRLDTTTAELLEVPRHDVALSELVSGFAEEYRRMLGPRAAMLEVEIAPGLTIQGDEDLIEVILENLVDNALSFSPAEGKVAVSLARAGDTALLTVTDDGPGIGQPLLPKIFGRYFSHRPASGAQSASDGPHFGIGLWLVRHHAEVLGGTVEARNREERGLTVTVRLPCREVL